MSAETLEKEAPQSRNSTWGEKLLSLKPQDNSIWKLTRCLRGKKKIPAIHDEYGLVYSNEDKAEEFADNLQKQCSLNYDNIDLDFVARINRDVRTKLRLKKKRRLLQSTSPEEVRRIIRSTKHHKSPGDQTGSRLSR
ncbi:hypothetical protein ILUMI_04328 [Ignelater luminosus]|uniref:Uncharacterized protein n=1 Tax=Ignelater luminosus TaxID=2038154 RepID=A0A8K0D9B7_IGNLU|nr:hypothetical protein ILUMI_04328 [Ignelater luminosus]